MAKNRKRPKLPTSNAPQLPDDPLAQLIDRAQRRDQTALAELVEKQVRPQALSICGKMLFNPADVQDIASSVVCKVLQQLNSYRFGKGSWRSWINRVIRNEAISFIRARGRRPIPSQQIDPPSREHDPAISVELRDRNARIQDGLGKLSAAEETAVRLLYFEGLSLRSIAAREDTKVATVGSRLFRARAKLRMLLGNVA